MLQFRAKRRPEDSLGSGVFSNSYSTNSWARPSLFSLLAGLIPPFAPGLAISLTGSSQFPSPWAFSSSAFPLLPFAVPACCNSAQFCRPFTNYV
jgi:hypothetical protein